MVICVGSKLSTASRYGALQKAFNDRLRAWYWQRNKGSRYQVWDPPGIVFARLKKDYHKHGRSKPSWPDWGFPEDIDTDDEQPVRLILGALGGHWVILQARQRVRERFVISDGDDGNLFHAYYRAMNIYELDPEEPDRCFPNLRLLHTNERLAPSFFAPGTLKSVHVHLPWAERETRPEREALVTQQFISDVSDALEVQGELHIVADDEAIAEQACGLLTRSRLFSPSVSFPFHRPGIPKSYPNSSLLQNDLKNSKGDKKQDECFFYTCWEKSPPRYPNFRFRGGTGYGEAVQGQIGSNHDRIGT